MKVKKRDGSLEEMRYDKITRRISVFCSDLNLEYIDPTYVTLKVTQGIYDGISTTELDVLAAETAASMTTTHPDYAKLAGRLSVSLLHKVTHKKFSQCIKELHSFTEPRTGKESSLIDDDVYQFVMDNKEALDGAIHQERDLDFDYFGFKTLERSYLLKIGTRVVERPQYMYMRVAVGICKGDLEMALRIYDDLSQHFYTHATPTLFNAGTKRPQLSSCFLIDIHDDSIHGIYKTLSDAALISQSAGGIGVNIHKIRAKGSYIKGTNGTSNGITPMLRVFNETARYVDQCFIPETEILTSTGYKKINQIDTNDKVLTSSGSYEFVSNVKKFENKNRKFKIITTKYGSETVTNGHLHLVVKNGKLHNNPKEALRLKLITPEWISADELTCNDLLLKINE